MASLVLGAAGAAVGFAIGGPWGARIGFAVGSYLGGRVGQKDTEIVGPRLNDTRVQASTWGTMLPIVYGTYRLAGNVIWSNGLRETRTTTSQSGKGGPTQTTTTYSYSVTCAISICEGPIIGIRRIWANGRLIYNLGTDANEATLIESNSQQSFFTLFTGTESQLPSAAMETFLGVGNVPAYRGQAYVVFNDIPLAPYGNAVPNFEFEVVAAGSVAASSWQTTATVAGAVATWVTAGNGRFVALQNFQNVYTSDDAGVTWTFRQTLTATGNIEVAFVGGQFIVPGRNVAETYTSSDGAAWTTRTMPASRFRRCVGFGNGIYVMMSDSTTDYETSSDGITWVTRTHLLGGQKEFVVFGAGRFVVAEASGSAEHSVDGINWTSYSLPLGTHGRKAFFGGGLFFIIPSTTTSQYMTSPDGLTWTVRTFPISAAWQAAKYGGGLFVVLANSTQSYVSTDAINWTLRTLPVFRSWSACAYSAPFFVAVHSGGNTDSVRYAAFGTLTPNTVALSSVVTDLTGRAGLAGSDIDVTALTDAVSGYVINRPSTVRESIEPLRTAFFFDAVESENVLKFVKRGGSVAAAIPFNDLGAYEYGSEAPDPIKLTRAQEVDLPARVSVRYANVSGDYLPGVEPSRRLVTTSRQEVIAEVPVAITPTRAAQIADVLMYDAHVGRTTFEFSTSRKYARVEPSDVVTLTNPTGTYRVRIVKKDEGGALIRFEGVADDATVYTSGATGATQQTAQTQITIPGASNLLLLDIPIVRDTDNNAGLYAMMGPASGATNWRGAQLLRSVDDLSFDDAGSVFTTPAIGVCTTTLPTFTGGNLPDESALLTVTLTSGTLATVTYAQFLDGGFVCVVGSELVFARVATLVSGTTYTITGFLRGRFGTEQHIGTHAANERFAVMSVAGTVRPAEVAASLNAARFYRGVSFGRQIANTASQTFTNTGNGLRPYSVTGVGGGRQANGDFIVTWYRRSRIDNGWRDGVDVPLGEESESYSIDVMNGGTVVRTIAATSPTLTYTSAQQTTDFGSAQTTITVRIYQISAVVGRGFVTTATLT